MGFADIDTKTSLNLGVFLSVVVKDRSDGNTATLYFSDGEDSSTQVDGTRHQWEGRVQKTWTIKKADQKIGTSRWNPPTASFTLRIDGAGDDLWTYADPTGGWQWLKGEAQVWLVDLDQAGTSGSRRQVKGTVESFVADPNALKLTIKGNSYRKRVDGRRMSTPSESFTEFIRPVYDASLGSGQGSHGELNGAITSTATTIDLKDVRFAFTTVDWESGMVAVIMTGTGGSGYVPAEACYIESGAGGPLIGGNPSGTITVSRGYAGTTPKAHADESTVWLLQQGNDPQYARDEAYEFVVPYIFGQSEGNKGIVVQVWPQVEIAGGGLLCWFSRGKTGPVGDSWLLDDTGDIETTPVLGTYNDFDDSIDPGNAGDWKTIEPHFLPCGSYCDAEIQHTFTPAWERNTSKAWFRVSGIRNPPNTAPLTTPIGIMRYLVTDETWAAGLTDAIDSGAVTSWDSGDWLDEYSGIDYFDNVTGIVPGIAEQDMPYLADVLCELCDVVNSDLFTRQGRWYPKYRDVAGTADRTIDESEPLKIRQWTNDTDYCNEIDAIVGQSILSQPKTSAVAGADPQEPEEVPYTAVVQSATDIDLDGEIISRTMSRQWWRFHMTRPWSISSSNTIQPVSSYWTTAHRRMLSLLSQQQLYIETELPSNFAWIEQGDTIAYDYEPYTTRLGQVREVTISRNGAAAPRVKLKSWHVNF
jgi:hypothetical protein